MPDPQPPSEPGEPDDDVQPDEAQPGPSPVPTEAAITPAEVPAPAADPPVTTTDVPGDEPPSQAGPDVESPVTAAPATDAPGDEPPSHVEPGDEPSSHAESDVATTGSEGTDAPAPADDDNDDSDGDDNDGDDNDGDEPRARRDGLLTKEVRIDAKALVAMVAAVVLVALAFGAYQLGQRQGQNAGDASKPTTSTVFQAPKDFVPIEDPETGVTISIPSNWVRYSVKDLPDKAIRLSGGIMNTNDSMLLRVNAYSTEITEANIADQKSVLDDLLGGEEIQVFVDETTKLGNLPALFYVYRFQDKASGKAGIHAHFFVFQGRKMVSLVLQALPEDRYALLASTFDAIANSLKVAPGPPPAFLEELAATPTTAAPGAPTTTTAGTPPSSGPATSNP